MPWLLLLAGAGCGDKAGPSDRVNGVDTPVTIVDGEVEGSRDPSPHLKEPVLVETDRSVVVYWTSTPPKGPQACPGNPTVSRRITLSEPLGQRELLDGSRWPPVPIG